MGIYKHLRELWKNPRKNLGQAYKDRLVQWRREPTTVRIERPTRLDRARSLGYKAKQGVILARQRVTRGGRQHETIKGGRRPKASSRAKNLDMSYQAVAEHRASEKFPNCEVMNSYFVAQDGLYAWYEVILVDRAHPAVKASRQLSQIAKQRGRTDRGRTMANRRSRQTLRKK